MNKQQVMNLLSQHRNEIGKRFAVKQLALFGSTVRGEARTDSDIDLLVEFDGPATFDGYIGLKFYLEDLFGSTVDLVTNKALRPELRPNIEKEAVRVS